MPLHRLFVPLLVLLSVPLPGQVINEFVANHTGTDDYSFVEIHGDPSTDYSGLTVVELAGDAEDDPGTITNLWSVGSTDGEGLWVSSFGTPNGTGDIDNGSQTLLLVDGFAGTLGQDLDVADDGTLDVEPWSLLVDGVAVSDDGPSDRTYLVVALGPSYDGLSVFPPGGASRIPDGTDTDGAADWVRNVFEGNGLPGFPDGAPPGMARNTPGAPNEGGPPFPTPVLDEVVLGQEGPDAFEGVDVWGISGTDGSRFSVVLVDGRSTGDPGEILFVEQVGSFDGGGIWTTSPLAPDSLPEGSATVLLVDTFVGSVGVDLDDLDDGTFDFEPWTAIVDGVALDGGGGGDVSYAAVVLGPGWDGLPGAALGVSRIPTGVDTDGVGDWVRDDPEGATGGAGGTLDPGEAWNTLGSVNRVREEDVWNGVGGDDPATLRAAIHGRIDDHQRYAYTSALTDTWDVLELADENPDDAGEVLAVYKNAAYAKVGGGNSFYNREHSWPQSYGFPDDAIDNSPRTDTHHLFLSDMAYNGTRGNLPFGGCTAACSELPTVANAGFGGQGGGYPGDSNWTNGSNAFEVWNHRRGDVARALLYLDVRYEGGTHGATGFGEPDLVLTDDLGLVQGTGGNAAVAYMGRLATLLAWHAADPPDDRERDRNDVVWRFQGNRNPFVDHPEWVACVFQAQCEPPLFADGFESGDTAGWSAVSP